MNEKKVTKVQILSVIKAIVEAQENEVFGTVDDIEVTGADIANYCDVTIDQIYDKAAKAKARAAAKKEEGDVIRADVESVLTEDWQPLSPISEAVMAKNEDATNSKVITRLTTLVKLGIAEKDKQRIDGRLLTVYRLAPAEE